METHFIYLGSTKETHRQIVYLGLVMGVKDIRKMSIGAKIAEMANNGDDKAQKICLENPQFFGQETNLKTN